MGVFDFLKFEKKKKRMGSIITTVADIGSLFMCVIYILFVVLLVAFDIGPPWLNYTLLGITVAYIIFFLIKIFSLNRVMKRQNARYVKKAFRYSKWAMRLINAVFVIATIAVSQFSDEHLIPMIGVMFVMFSFLVSVLWDVGLYVLRRKLRELKQGWNNMSPKERSKRIQHAILGFVEGVDHFSGINITETLSLSAVKVAEKRKLRRCCEETLECAVSENTLCKNVET